MAQPRDPEAVVRALVAGIVALTNGDTGQVDTLADLYAETTDVREPLNPLGDTPMLTREQVRSSFAASVGAVDALQNFRAEDLVVHRTQDPEVVIADYRYRAEGPAADVDIPCVFVVRVRDGLIVSSRDHTDHLALARALGRLPQLAMLIAARAPSLPH